MSCFFLLRILWSQIVTVSELWDRDPATQRWEAGDVPPKMLFLGMELAKCPYAAPVCAGWSVALTRTRVLTLGRFFYRVQLVPAVGSSAETLARGRTQSSISPAPPCYQREVPACLETLDTAQKRLL